MNYKIFSKRLDTYYQLYYLYTHEHNEETLPPHRASNDAASGGRTTNFNFKLKTMENKDLDTEKMIADILHSQKDVIKANIVEQMKKSIGEHITWSLRDELSKITSEFVKTEMTEEIKELLKAQKPVILEGLKDAFVKIGAQVSIAMYETAAKNLSTSSYNTSQILKKILE